MMWYDIPQHNNKLKFYGEFMIYKLNVNYSGKERQLLEEYGCEIIPEIKLSKTDFTDKEIPRRMIKYGGQYIAEIIDDETDSIIWAVLSNWKGVWHFEAYYDSLETMIRGM